MKKSRRKQYFILPSGKFFDVNRISTVTPDRIILVDEMVSITPGEYERIKKALDIIESSRE